MATQNQNQNDKYISVSEYAKRIGKSTTFVYKLIAEKKLAVVPFNRGRYNGYLIVDND